MWLRGASVGTRNVSVGANSGILRRIADNIGPKHQIRLKIPEFAPTETAADLSQKAADARLKIPEFAPTETSSWGTRRKPPSRLKIPEFAPTETDTLGGGNCDGAPPQDS